MKGECILDIGDLTVLFGQHCAVDGVSLCVREAEFVALAGESGSGKTVTCLAVGGLLPGQGKIAGGSIRYRGREVTAMNRAALRDFRRQSVSYIFQEPTLAMNPVFTVGFQIAEAVRPHREDRGRVRERVRELLECVRLPDPRKLISAYPHELSGGMLQRIMIAMALAGRPKLLIADEPTTALDVTIQAEVMRLLDDLRERMRMAVLFVTHNLALAARHADRIYVMKNGNVVEEGGPDDLINRPSAEYTRRLIRAVPNLYERTV